jgi:two-component system invasion response regulator UvrY
MRAGVQRVLADAGYLRVTGEAASFDEALRLTRNTSPRLVLVNATGAASDVLDGVSKLHRQAGSARLLVLCGETDLFIQERLLQMDVAGCLSDLCTVEELFEAIDTVLRGERYISDSLARKLAERRLPNRERSPFDQLSHRELQVLLLVAEGKNTAVIARDLCLTQKTVNTYRNRILSKVRADTEVELMHLAARHGLLRIARTA